MTTAILVNVAGENGFGKLIVETLGLEHRAVVEITAGIYVPAERVREAVLNASMDGECWLFDGYRPSGAHGRIEHQGRQHFVHRLAFACVSGPIPNGMKVCHRCDVGACFRPSHLFLGTQQDNIADMERKGRARRVGWKAGAGNPNAQLSDEAVIELRRIAAETKTPQRELARQFGISQSSVGRIIHRKVRPL